VRVNGDAKTDESRKFLGSRDAEMIAETGATTFAFANQLRGAFDHKVTIWIVSAIAMGLISASVLIRVFKARQKISDSTFKELILRTRSWYVLAAAMVVPILLGTFWVWLFFLGLSLFCFWEFSRATNLSESRMTMFAVFIAIVVTFVAVLDHWMDFFTTSWALGICLIFVAALIRDQPVRILTGG
jgi:predicted CDP-diglyceride synthetase/phosphatidate cytidylyltransferase